jgi:hypothetical protein
MTLSSSVANETFRSAPLLAAVIKDAELLRQIFEVAAEISRRSAKHSADFLNTTPDVMSRFSDFGANGEQQVARAAVVLASAFASRAGGIAAEVWATLPPALAALSLSDALRLLISAGEFLERGGSAALNVLVAGGEILRGLPEAFADWTNLLWAIAEHGNAGLIAFVRYSPSFFRALAGEKDHARAVELALRIIAVTLSVARVDGEAALACFRSSPKALRGVSVEQFEEWARAGLSQSHSDARARRSYYALETRGSHDALHTGGEGLALEKVQHMLRLYVEGLTGQALEVAPLAAVPDEARIGDGRTIHLPSMVALFGDEEMDFRLYKVLAAHGAGQVEFGTHERDAPDLRAAYSSIAEAFAPENLDARDAFALDGYINEMEKGGALRRASSARSKTVALIVACAESIRAWRATWTRFAFICETPGRALLTCRLRSCPSSCSSRLLCAAARSMMRGSSTGRSSRNSKASSRITLVDQPPRSLTR